MIKSMEYNFEFNIKNLEETYKTALGCGYNIISCLDYYNSKNSLSSLTIVNRIDIEYSLYKAELLQIFFDKLGIKGTFFVRLHSPQYNPFSFENYRILKSIKESGHEIGYHSEIIDQSVIWSENAKSCLLRDIKILNEMLSIKVKGVASHGGHTGLNNLDFWKDHKPKEFGLCYEAYDETEDFNLFYDSLYVSDSNKTKWKCYKKGKLCVGNDKTFRQHIQDLNPLINVLLHCDHYYEKHFYDHESNITKE